ncbi:MAG: sugar phosphate nucleotidyltransferase [Thermoguttaceae bacterium]|jgi:UTP--glucose-1-phosphate uridylyltransferase
MKIRKAVITAAGPNQNRLPLQRFVDIDGTEKTALAIIIEEVVAAGVEEIAVVIRHGDQPAYAEAAGGYARMLSFAEQPEPRGYGDALYRAAEFVDGQPFVHLVSDHLYLSGQSRRCAQQLVEAAQTQECPVSAVQPTRESMLRYYGAVGGRREPGRTDLYVIERVMEKPTPSEAEQHLIVPGLRAGYYLCLFGMHVLTPVVMEILGESISASPDPAAPGAPVGSRSQPVMLSPALEELARRERYLAMELDGTRHNIGVKYGMLLAQLALALAGKDRDEILARMIELLARGKENDAC